MSSGGADGQGSSPNKQNSDERSPRRRHISGSVTVSSPLPIVPGGEEQQSHPAPAPEGKSSSLGSPQRDDDQHQHPAPAPAPDRVSAFRPYNEDEQQESPPSSPEAEGPPVLLALEAPQPPQAPFMMQYPWPGPHGYGAPGGSFFYPGRPAFYNAMVPTIDVGGFIRGGSSGGAMEAGGPVKITEPTSNPSPPKKRNRDGGAKNAPPPQQQVGNQGGQGDRPFECSVCGRGFASSKAMFGHMRSHPGRGWKGAHPPPTFNASEEFANVPGVNRPELEPREDAAADPGGNVVEEEQTRHEDAGGSKSGVPDLNNSPPPEED